MTAVVFMVLRNAGGSTGQYSGTSTTPGGRKIVRQRMFADHLSADLKIFKLQYFGNISNFYLVVSVIGKYVVVGFLECNL